MTHHVDLFWSFRSPYSYLILPRLIELERAWDLELAVRPVRPLALRQPDFFQREQPDWMHYLLTDVARLAEYHGMPFAAPNPDPVVMDYSVNAAAADQPHIGRLTRLGIAAAKTPHALAFLNAVSALIWSGEDWLAEGRLAACVATTGLHLAALDAAITADPAAHDAIIADNEAALAAARHWGVPTLAYKSEPFFGQDRLDLLLWRLKQDGLQPRRKTV